MGEAKSILIAEDHPIYRDGLRRALEGASFRVVAEVADGVAALEQIRAAKPDIALLDIRLPKLDGVAITRRIREERIPVEVVFLTAFDNEDIFEVALELGVKGYLLKECTESELFRCLTAVASGQNYTSPAMTTFLVGKVRKREEFIEKCPGLTKLTPQERVILKQISDGKTSKEIAHALGISSKTVDQHRTNICSKLDLHGPAALNRFAALNRSIL
jgi:DNA-binding NarL/FixJ family response regulator